MKNNKCYMFYGEHQVKAAEKLHTRNIQEHKKEEKI